MIPPPRMSASLVEGAPAGVISNSPGDNLAKPCGQNLLVTLGWPRGAGRRVPAVPASARVPCSHEVGMTDSQRRDVPDPTQPLPYGTPGYTDPAYSNQAPMGSYYQPLPSSNPTQQLPPYGYDPNAADRYGRSYPPGGAPPEPPSPNGRGPRKWLWVLAAITSPMTTTTRAAGTELPHPVHHDHPDTDHHAQRRSVTAVGHDPAGRIDGTGRDRDGGLRRGRVGPGHQHHLRRRRRPTADRVQRDAALEQGSRVGEARQPVGERQHHQRRP